MVRENFQDVDNMGLDTASWYEVEAGAMNV